MSATGEAMDIVLADAQRLGYAEADPTADVDGFDAAAKLVVLAGIAFRRHLKMPDVPRRSIRPLSSADFRYAARLGCTIRQVSQVQATEGASTVRSDRRSCRKGRASGATKAPTTWSPSTASTVAKAASAARVRAARPRPLPSCPTCWR